MSREHLPGREREPNIPAENFAVRTVSGPINVLENEIRSVVLQEDKSSGHPRKRDSWRVGLRVMYNEMVFPEPRRVKNTLEYAARSGAKVTLVQDIGYSKNVLDEDIVPIRPDWTLVNDKHRRTRRRRIRFVAGGRVKQLQESGVEVYNTYPVWSPVFGLFLPWSTRDHEHLMFIEKPNGESVAWILSANNARAHYKMLEANVEFTDPRISKEIIDEFFRFGHHRRKYTARISCTEDTDLVVGPGKENLPYFIDIVNGAQESLYVASAFVSVGRFAEAVNNAKRRGVHVRYIANKNPVYTAVAVGSVVKDGFNPFVGREFPTLYPSNLEIHGKVILADPESPRQIAVIGTDNFIGGNNEEISVISINPILIKNLSNWFRDNIGADNLALNVDKDTAIKLPLGL